MAYHAVEYGVQSRVENIGALFGVLGLESKNQWVRFVGADKIQEMDGLVWANANAQLNLTHILEPIFDKVRFIFPTGFQGVRSESFG